MKRQNVRTLSLVVGTFTYLLIGAAVFDSLESETEHKRGKFLEEVRDNLKKKYKISEEDYKMVEVVIIESKPHKAGPQWKFTGAFYFATVVLAMIGYGHSTPVTIAGKAFCMGYAMVGIPLGLIMFQSIGERLNKFASVVIQRAKQVLRCSSTEATEMNLMMATGLLSSIIITTGAAVFSRYEGWTYFDSFYYCFVTLTTIGFGDYVALQFRRMLIYISYVIHTKRNTYLLAITLSFLMSYRTFCQLLAAVGIFSGCIQVIDITVTRIMKNNDQALTKKPGYVALSLVFILFGLAVVAASINLLVLRFMTMNAEDVRREDVELQASTEHVITLDDDVVNVNGKLLAGHVGTVMVSDVDQVSVCSCTCLGPAKCQSHNLLESDYRSGGRHFCSRLKRSSV